MHRHVDEKRVYRRLSSGRMGNVRIFDEVVAVIAGLAATEVEGVHSMTGNITNELVGKISRKSLTRDVKILVEDKKVTIRLALNLEYGYSISETSRAVQENVKVAVENMTGLTVTEVNVRVFCVNIENQK